MSAHTPTRSCAGCGRRAPKGELVRFVARAGELTQADKAPGRGVYTCRRLACFERALAARVRAHAASRTVLVEPALVRLYTDR